MSKFLVFCIIAVMVLMAIPAYAEVQNVKVSGDLTARYILRQNYDLDKNSSTIRGSDKWDNYYMGTVGVEVTADLTDNVSTVVRLANQKDWGSSNAVDNLASGITTNSFNVLVDLANVTLKELVYSPLTVTIGRQNLWFGRGFIIGAKQRDPEAAITAKEYTTFNAFDAIRGTLDFDPWKIDMVYSTVQENVVNVGDDLTLMGANVGYKFDSYKGEAEAYVWRKDDKSKVCYPDPTTASPSTCQNNNVNVFGGRGSLEPISNLTVAGELAWENGKYSAGASTRKRSAIAADASADYMFKEVKWAPSIGLEYIFYSGEKNPGSTTTDGWAGWDPMYRGKFDTAIREFQNLYYTTIQREGNVATSTLDQDSGATNEHQILVKGSLKPMNNLKLAGVFGWFAMDKAQAMTIGGASRNKDIGNELDLSLTYDYTEDVSFNLLAGWFFPGKYWISGTDDTATDIVGTVKVAF